MRSRARTQGKRNERSATSVILNGFKGGVVFKFVPVAGRWRRKIGNRLRVARRERKRMKGGMSRGKERGKGASPRFEVISLNVHGSARDGGRGEDGRRLPLFKHTVVSRAETLAGT